MAAPAITGVVNSASLIAPGRPNYGIAQGSIFNVFGSGLGPATIVAAASVPLQLTLGGTTVSVTVGGMTVNAPLFYSLSTQLAAILPSNTPAGMGTIAVSYGGATANFAITVVVSNVGIYTVDDSGTGAGVVTFPDYSLVTSGNSAAVCNVLTMWATGLGPTTGSDAALPLQVDLGTDIQVYVGGVLAPVSYQGRAYFAGLDQVNFTVPVGVTPGCNVSVVIQTGSLVSNTVSIPVAAAGKVCSNPSSEPVIFSSPSGSTFGQLSLNATTTAGATSYTANALFGRFFVSESFPNGTPAFGSCFVTGGDGIVAIAAFVQILNVGPSLTVTPPSGAPLVLAENGPGSYSGVPLSLPQGTYQLSNGAGGSDVGPFTASFTVAPPLVWTNQNAAVTVDRTQPLTVTWTGGDPAGYVLISLQSPAAAPIPGIVFTPGTQVTATCAAPVSAGKFTVPPNVLLAIIPSSAGSVSLTGYSAASLTIQGLDATVTSTYSTSAAATFQ